MECALQHCPLEIDEEQWKELCKAFNSDDFKKRSQINKDNQSKQTIKHAAGSMGFARHEFALSNHNTGERPQMSSLWKETHWSKKKENWVNEEAGAVYEQVTAEIKSLKENGVDADEDQVYLNILGPKKCYVRGRGRGPKSSSSAFKSSAKKLAEKEFAIARKKSEEARKEAEEARKEAKETNQKMEEMMTKQDQISSQMKLFWDFLADKHDNLPFRMDRWGSN